MLIEQIIEFKWRGPGPYGHTRTLTTGYFHDKTKISGLIFTAKILHEATYVAFLYLGQITYKILPQNAGF